MNTWRRGQFMILGTVAAMILIVAAPARSQSAGRDTTEPSLLDVARRITAAQDRAADPRHRPTPLVTPAAPQRPQPPPRTDALDASRDRALQRAREAERSAAAASTSAASTTAPDKPEHPDKPKRPIFGNAETDLQSNGLGQDIQTDASDSAEKGGVAGGWVLNTITALGVVIALIFLTRAVLTRMSGTPAAAKNHAVGEVLTRIAIAPKNHIVLVRLGQRVLVLGDGPNGLSLLTELSEPEEVAEVLRTVTASKPQSVTQNFNHMLGRFHREYSPRRQAHEEGLDTAEIHVDTARDQLSSLLTRVRRLQTTGDER